MAYLPLPPMEEVAISSRSHRSHERRRIRIFSTLQAPGAPSLMVQEDLTTVVQSLVVLKDLTMVVLSLMIQEVPTLVIPEVPEVPSPEQPVTEQSSLRSPLFLSWSWRPPWSRQLLLSWRNRSWLLALSAPTMILSLLGPSKLLALL